MYEDQDPGHVYGILEGWEYSGELTLEQAQELEQNLDAFLEEELARLEEAIDEEEEPYESLGLFTRLTSFLNRGSGRFPYLLRRLSGWVKRMRSTLERLARKLGADSYSIGVSMPVGVSFDLSFPIPPAPSGPPSP
jgi:hypothetical protein